MASWKLATNEKKSIIETEIWLKDGMVISRETIWRWGSIIITSDNIPEIDLENNVELYLDDLEYDYYLDDLVDGDLNVEYDDNLSDEEQEELDELWDEGDEFSWREAGWRLDDTEISFCGPLTIEEVTDGDDEDE